MPDFLVNWLANWRNWSPGDWMLIIGPVIYFAGARIGLSRAQQSVRTRTGNTTTTTYHRPYDPSPASKRRGRVMMLVGGLVLVLGVWLKLH
jgi:hypothetical protein